MTNEEAINWLDAEIHRGEFIDNEWIDCVNIEKLKQIRELLIVQQPRVLTLEEVRKLQSLRDGAVWLEVGTGLMPALPEMAMPDITFFVAIPLMNYHSYCENEFYGKTWRCWTARPTDEQRKAVKWDV